MHLVDPPDPPADTACRFCGAIGGVHLETVFRPRKATSSTHYYCTACDRSWKMVKATDLAPVKRVLDLLP